MTDKSKELTTKVKLVNDRLHFEGGVKGNSLISIDYIPPVGDKYCPVWSMIKDNVTIDFKYSIKTN